MVQKRTTGAETSASGQAVKPRVRIAWKITTVIILVMAILAVANILFIRNRVGDLMQTEFESKAKAIAISLAGSSEDTLVSGNVEVIQSLVDGFRVISGVRYVYVENDQGKVAAHTFDQGFPPDLLGTNPVKGEDPFRIQAIEKKSVGSVLEVGVPILFGVAGVAHVGMDQTIIDSELDRLTGQLVTQFLIASVAGILLLHLIVTYLLRHLSTVISVLSRVGSGDFTARVKVPTNDEFLLLAEHVNGTISQLGQMIRRIRQAFSAIAKANEKISRVYNEVLEGTEQQTGLAAETMDSVRSSKKMIDDVTQGIHVLENSTNDSFSSIMEMGASIEEVSSMSDSLFQSVRESNVAIESMSASIGEISRNLQSLSRASDETASAMSEMSASIVEVRSNAESTSRDATGMTHVAEEGAKVSKNAMMGILAIKESAQQVSGLINIVTERIEEINEILSFITNITGKTNLLALNAAIIAAQAGAQGKGFGVVADEINELAQNTKAQTNRIAQVIQGIREEVARTSEAVEDSTMKVEEGVRLTEQVTSALEKIMESTMEVASRVEEIAQTTSEQASTSNRVLETTQHLTQSAINIKEVSEKQSKSSEKLLEMSHLIRQASEKVKTSTEEQSVTSQQINKDLTRMSDTVRGITESTEIQVVNGAKVLKMTEDLTSVIENNRAAVHGLKDVIEDLTGRMEALQAELTALVVEGEEEER